MALADYVGRSSGGFYQTSDASIVPGRVSNRGHAMRLAQRMRRRRLAHSGNQPFDVFVDVVSRQQWRLSSGITHLWQYSDPSDGRGRHRHINCVGPRLALRSGLLVASTSYLSSVPSVCFTHLHPR